jgi:excinuclease UvrABC nuclease subunit
MPINAPRHRFTTWQISGAPAAPGVYLLWEGDEVIYIGTTGGEASLRARLQDHYARRADPHDATHFSWEITTLPREREAELLEEFRVANSRFPRCNANS